MTRLPVLKPRVVCRALERAGFVLRKSKGGHRIYVKERRHVTVPYHAVDIKPGTLASIIQQTGMSLEEFLELL
jgi:predicted RNA binding protein YcfA (HicA-like mRNA interferase family)